MIYLDHHATTPCAPDVLAAMRPWFETEYANPHSTEHAPGRRAAEAVENARCEIAALIGATPAEIIFTSGATEANNLAIKGAARFAGAAGRGRIVTAANEHKCVLESVRDLAREGFEPCVLPIQPDGGVDPDALAAALRTPTLLVSVMAAHNETGRIQDIVALAALARAAGAKFHSDIAQAAGRMAVDVRGWDIDLASVSAHKLYGPKGIGALFVRRHPRMRLAPLFSGGGQERGLRPGTIPTPLAVGFGEACRLARLALTEDAGRIAALRDRLLAGLSARIAGLAVNGPLGNGPPDAIRLRLPGHLSLQLPGHLSLRLPGNLSLRLPGLRALDVIAACPGLAVSTGSACTSAEIAPSHALLALGLGAEDAAATLRVGIGRFTSAADIDGAIQAIAGAFDALTHRIPTAAEA
jgi:cysteine desulfurase